VFAANDRDMAAPITLLSACHCPDALPQKDHF
jgi:hypothetical protein